MENTNKTIKIVIADDHAMLRQALAACITSDSMQVIFQASDGKDLLQKLKEANTLPDICILDISMGGLNGYDTIAKLKKTWPSIRVLVLSMHDHEFGIINMFRKGASGFIAKGRGLDELLNAINAIYTNGFYHPELITDNTKKLKKFDEFQYNITAREAEFLVYCCSDLRYSDIAQKMGVSTRTAEGYRDSLFSKLSLQSRAGLVMFALQTGIAQLNPKD